MLSPPCGYWCRNSGSTLHHLRASVSVIALPRKSLPANKWWSIAISLFWVWADVNSGVVSACMVLFLSLPLIEACPYFGISKLLMNKYWYRDKLDMVAWYWQFLCVAAIRPNCNMSQTPSQSSPHDHSFFFFLILIVKVITLYYTSRLPSNLGRNRMSCSPRIKKKTCQLHCWLN